MRKRRAPIQTARLLPCALVASLAVAAPRPAGGDAGSDPLDAARPSQPVAAAATSIGRGFARPLRRAVLSVGADGVLRRVLVREGDRVRDGEELARLDDRALRAEVASARTRAGQHADLEYERHALRLAERELELLRQTAGTPFELEEAEISVDQSRARVQAAEEARARAQDDLALAEARLEAIVVRAPFDGRVVRVHRRSGEGVRVADELVEIVDARVLEAELRVDAAAALAMTPGLRYRLEPEPVVAARAPRDAGGAPAVLVGELRFVDDRLDAGAGTVRCVFHVPNHEGAWPSAFAVRLDDADPLEPDAIAGVLARADADADAPGRDHAGRAADRID